MVETQVGAQRVYGDVVVPFGPLRGSLVRCCPVPLHFMWSNVPV